jgi:cytochrome c oxidase assembly factor CtaG
VHWFVVRNRHTARHSIISQIFLVLAFLFLHVIVDVVAGHVEAPGRCLLLVLVLGNCTARELLNKSRVVYESIVVVVFICRGTQFEED